VVGVNTEFNERCDVVKLEEGILWNDYIIKKFFTCNILRNFYYISGGKSSDEDELLTNAHVVQIGTHHNIS